MKRIFVGFPILSKDASITVSFYCILFTQYILNRIKNATLHFTKIYISFQIQIDINQLMSHVSWFSGC